MKRLILLLLVFVAASAFGQTPNDLGEAYYPPNCGGAPVFADVPCDGTGFAGGIYDAYATALWHEGITSGCAVDPLRFCPDRPITRAEQAVLILRAEHRRKILAGVRVGCQGEAYSPSWAKCTGTVANTEVRAGMVIVGTYQTRASDDQIPVRIFNIHDGGFSFEIQTGQTFMWLAAPLVPQSPEPMLP